ncbi:MAG: hypothetical protein LLF76_00420 [Planctomycetaceae bacterium]|nr:hypothetical protein [Planctomycetaceae bacterium]
MKNEPKDILEQAVEALRRQTERMQGPSEDLIRQTLERIEQQTRTNPFVEGILKMKPLSRFAAAAMIIIGISMLFLFNSSRQGIAMADVYDKVLRAETIKYRTKTFIPAESAPREEILWLSKRYGIKRESYINNELSHIEYTLPRQKRMISVLLKEKQYIEIKADEEQYSIIDRFMPDPRELVQRMIDGKHKSLGKSDIDGVDVEGFESNDPKISGSETILLRIWVDIRTLYPVRIEKEDSILDENSAENKRITIHTVSYDFQWNVNMDESTFTPFIPSDFILHDTIQLFKFDEKAAIGGLRKFAELTGHFPTIMGLNEFIEEVNNTIKNSVDPNSLANMSSQDRRELTAPFDSLLMFYGQLHAEKKDPVYYGDRVSPENADAVLLRWKLDNGKYKVIFGDLSSVEMEYEDMVKIEPKAETIE